MSIAVENWQLEPETIALIAERSGRTVEEVEAAVRRRIVDLSAAIARHDAVVPPDGEDAD